MAPLIVRLAAPGPSIVSASVTVGRLLPSVIVPVTAKVIVSAPGTALASRIAWRSDPGPESLVVVTLKLVAWTGAAETSAIATATATATPRAMPTNGA